MNDDARVGTYGTPHDTRAATQLPARDRVPNSQVPRTGAPMSAEHQTLIMLGGAPVSPPVLVAIFYWSRISWLSAESRNKKRPARGPRGPVRSTMKMAGAIRVQAPADTGGSRSDGPKPPYPVSAGQTRRTATLRDLPQKVRAFVLRAIALVRQML
jgi:hypothetical protein